MSAPSLGEFRYWAEREMSDEPLDALGGYSPRELTVRTCDELMIRSGLIEVPFPVDGRRLKNEWFAATESEFG